MRLPGVRFRLRTLLFAVLISAAAVNAVVLTVRVRHIMFRGRPHRTVVSLDAPPLAWGSLCLAVWAAVRARSAGRSKRSGN